MALLGEELEAELGEAALQPVTHGPVARPRRSEPFVEHRAEAGVESEDHRDRRGVVVLASRADVVADESEVEVPRLRRGLPGTDPVDGTGGERDRRETRRDAEALLRARVGRVDPPGVDLERDPTERRDRVDEEERVGSLERGEWLDRVLDSGRRLGVHDGDEPAVGPGTLRGEERLGVDRTAPRGLDARQLRPGPAGDLAHPLAEHTVHPDDHVVAGLEEVHEARFHARGAGAAHRQGECVLGAEDRAQPRRRLVEQREEVGIEVPEQRPRERGGDLGVGVRRSWSEEESISERHAVIVRGRPTPPLRALLRGCEQGRPLEEQPLHIGLGFLAGDDPARDEGRGARDLGDLGVGKEDVARLGRGGNGAGRGVGRVRGVAGARVPSQHRVDVDHRSERVDLVGGRPVVLGVGAGHSVHVRRGHPRQRAGELTQLHTPSSERMSVGIRDFSQGSD